MSFLFEELDYCPTPIGALSLRRRHDPRLGGDVFEVKLREEHLMSSFFTASEVALARLGLAACDGDALRVVVGGLGLGYTAQTVLQTPRVAEMIVVEFLAPVIEWHAAGLLPMGTQLVDDPRCRLVEGDFFAMAAADAGFDPQTPGAVCDAILVDIDHAPDQVLDDRSTSFYRADGLRGLARHLRPGGIFGLWSDAVENPDFTDRLREVFGVGWAEAVTFDNPLTGQPFTQTVYLARKGAE